MQYVGGEIMKEFAIGDFERSPPHLFLYLFLFKRKTKVETKRTLPILNTGESKLYSNKKWEVLEAPVYGRKLDHVGSSCSCHGDIVPNFTTIYWFIIVQAARLVHKYNNNPYIDIMIRKIKYNHPKGR